jgi:hypothetical protein
LGPDRRALRHSAIQGTRCGIVLGQAVDRPLADKRIDARLLVEGQQFA